MALPTIKEIEELIGDPADQWAGRCYEIVCRVLKADLVIGEDIFGAWVGPIHPKSFFAGRPFTQHGWILTPNDHIVDPTRFVFEARAPYVFAGLREECPEYDRGANAINRALLGDHPPPAAEEDEERFPVEFAGFGHDYVWAIFPDFKSQLTWKQLHWLAHRTPAELGVAGKPVFEGIIAAGKAGLIPLDNRIEVLGREGISQNPRAISPGSPET